MTESAKEQRASVSHKFLSAARPRGVFGGRGMDDHGMAIMAVSMAAVRVGWGGRAAAAAATAKEGGSGEVDIFTPLKTKCQTSSESASVATRTVSSGSRFRARSSRRSRRRHTALVIAPHPCLQRSGSLRWVFFLPCMVLPSLQVSSNHR